MPAIPTSIDTPPPLPLPPSRGQRPITIRRLGWVLVVLGPCLSIAMGFIALFIYSAMAGHDISGRGGDPRWHGSAQFTRTTFELLGSVFVFGIVAMFGGWYQVRHSRRSPALIVLMLLTVAAMVYFGCNL